MVFTHRDILHAQRRQIQNSSREGNGRPKKYFRTGKLGMFLIQGQMKLNTVLLSQLNRRHSTVKQNKQTKEMLLFSRAIQFQVSDFYLEAYSPDRTISVDTQQCYSKTLPLVLDPETKLPLAKMPFCLLQPIEYSWPPPEPGATGHHRGKHHVGKSSTSCRSSTIAKRTEALLCWCLEAFDMCCLTNKTKQSCPKKHSRKYGACLTVSHSFTQSGNRASMCHLRWKSRSHKGYSLADCLDFSG